MNNLKSLTVMNLKLNHLCLARYKCRQNELFLHAVTSGGRTQEEPRQRLPQLQLDVTHILTKSPPAQQKHKVDLFHKLRHVMNELIDLRRQLIQGHLAQDQTREIKRHITVRLDWGNE